MHSYSSNQVERTYLADYQPPLFQVPDISLEFQLHATDTWVKSTMTIIRASPGDGGSFLLNGKRLKLESIEVDGERLDDSQYSLNESGLTVHDPKDSFELCITNRVDPSQNKELSGLYFSGNMLCTQCEAEGFRNITYFPDRPDILSRYSVRIEASRLEFPVLLSNGELVDSGNISESRHFASWVDPHPKPSYLFALVAGDLAVLEDQFITQSGRPVKLEFYTPQEHLDKCDHAMSCLRRAMKWDEDKYGCEYDLNRYMIVAVDHFNMGAMENKGLNVFNSKYVYAKPDTATDQDFHAVECVIAHEYFHNWSGNRVTLRDWFQLSLKEGFTIFREQQFSADMGSAAVQRVRDVHMVKLHQFREDAGPASHAVQPDSYMTIDNFYTITVYNKGSELIRMLYLMIGAKAYRAGTDLYFERYDGSAATVEDFITSMEQASDRDLRQFRRWYQVAGTPKVFVTRQYDKENRSYTLTFEQSRPDSGNGRELEPMHIPIMMALLDNQGRRVPITTDAGNKLSESELLFELTDQKQSVTFRNIDSKPTPSVLRGFSAPIILEDPESEREMHFIMAHDDDAYCQWNAAQNLSKIQLLNLIEDYKHGHVPSVDEKFLSSFGAVLVKAADSPQFSAMLLETPSEISIAQAMKVVDPVAVHDARKFLVRELANHFNTEFSNLYGQLQGDWGDDRQAAGKRALRNLCLSYLMEINDAAVHELAYLQFDNAANMTDLSAALTALVNSDSPKRQTALDSFYENWRDDQGVIDKWFRIQATAARPDTYQNVIELSHHTAFSISTPNRVYSLIGAFSNSNPYCFHAKDGSGYDLLTRYVLAIDPDNPVAAAQLAGAFSEIHRFDDRRQRAMRHRVESIASNKTLSVNVFEVVERILKSFAA
ncbi:MAG: aminopeptidase N [Acidiferrobacterales bacterium]|nr:aminopeptidase N [Acidiferrobacterales bacterium]